MSLRKVSEDPTKTDNLCPLVSCGLSLETDCYVFNLEMLFTYRIDIGVFPHTVKFHVSCHQESKATNYYLRTVLILLTLSLSKISLLCSKDRTLSS